MNNKLRDMRIEKTLLLATKRRINAQLQDLNFEIALEKHAQKETEYENMTTKEILHC